MENEAINYLSRLASRLAISSVSCTFRTLWEIINFYLGGADTLAVMDDAFSRSSKTELRSLAQSLPATVLRSRADSTTKMVVEVSDLCQCH